MNIYSKLFLGDYIVCIIGVIILIFVIALLIIVVKSYTKYQVTPLEIGINIDFGEFVKVGETVLIGSTTPSHIIAHKKTGNLYIYKNTGYALLLCPLYTITGEIDNIDNYGGFEE